MGKGIANYTCGLACMSLNPKIKNVFKETMNATIAKKPSVATFVQTEHF